MRIAFNLVFPGKQLPVSHTIYFNHLLLHLSGLQPQHQFIVLCNKPLTDEVNECANVTPLLVTSALNNALNRIWWQLVTLPGLIRKHNIDVLVSTTGVPFLLRTLPGVLMITGIAGAKSARVNAPVELPAATVLTKAKAIVAVSAFVQSAILRHYAVPVENVFMVPPAPLQGPGVMEWEQKEVIKKTYAEGCEYFLFTGGFHSNNNLLTLLKAFSLFKKRQQTNMKLLITGDLAPGNKAMLEKIESYKFRKGVIVLGTLPRQAYTEVLAGAYALVYPGLKEIMGLSVLESMQCGVPVICSNTGSLKQLVGDNALLSDPLDAAEMAEQMKRLFKDENLRGRLVAQGLALARKYTWQASAEEMWKAIEHAASK